MVRQRTDRSQIIRVRNLAGGLLRKMDTSRLPSNYFRDARNMRFSSGSPQTRSGSIRAAQITRPSGAMKFPGTNGNHVLVPVNNSCPLFTGLTDFTIEYVERPSWTPAGAAGDLMFLGKTDPSGYAGLRVFSTVSALRRVVGVRDVSMGTESVKWFGTLDDTSGNPTDRRYYTRIRRKGRDLDIIMVGAAAGIQTTTWTNVFTSKTSKIKAGVNEFQIGGAGQAITTGFGITSTIDELRIWNTYLPDTGKYWWSEHPMTEHPELLLCLRMNDASGAAGAIITDDSLYGNDGYVVGTITPVAGEVEGLAVGQLVTEFSPGRRLERLIGAGGSIYREVLR